MSGLSLAAPDPESGKPSASIVYVTPEMAERWLTRNIKNRPIKVTKLPGFVRDMSEGRWQITGEAIKFDTFGNLLDGQNRLTAIGLSGATVPMFVVRGLTTESQAVMDTGTPRSAGDALHLRDYPNSKNLAATAVAYEGWITGFFRNAMHQSNPHFTNSEVIEIIAYTPGLIEASRMVAPMRRSLPLPHGAVAAACYRFTQINSDDAAEFFDRIHELRTGGKGDPLNTLLKRSAEMRESRQRVWNSTSLYLLTRSWNAFRSGEQLLKLQLGSERIGWATIPEPK